MAANEPESIPIHDKQYVTIQDAARYLGISKRWLEDMILLGKVEATHIESRHFIELETLKAFAEKRYRKKQSAWDKLDEWKG
jgi:excisionase family DNA binding protein